MSNLKTRKRLLVTESEVNRAELGKDMQHFTGEITRVKKQIFAAGSIASTAAMIATAISVARHRKGDPEHTHAHTNGRMGKMGWISSALAGARLGTSLFFKIKSLFRE